MKAIFACASGAALLFAVTANAGEPAPAAAAAVETPSDGAPVQELADPTAALEPTVEGVVAPEGEGDIDAETADAEAPADAPADAAAPEAAEEPNR